MFAGVVYGRAHVLACVANAALRAADSEQWWHRAEGDQWEPETFQVLQAVVQPDSVVVDLGERGVRTVLLRMCNPRPPSATIVVSISLRCIVRPPACLPGR